MNHCPKCNTWFGPPRRKIEVGEQAACGNCNLAIEWDGQKWIKCQQS